MSKGKKANSRPEAEDILVQFNTLHFDPVNPRGEPEEDEEKIRALYGAQKETKILAEHIAEHGQNPIDRLALVTHPKLPGHYVVREGNRRLCAMQLLRDPQRAPNATVRKVFEGLSKEGRAIPSQIQAVLFNNKASARVWMSVKHEGPQGGLGTLDWGPTQKARFNREGETGATRPKNPNRQAEALLTYAVDQRLITPEERKLISITTLTRYLPNVRTALALLNTEDCTTNAPRSEFDIALKRFLKDTLGAVGDNSKATVNSRSSAKDRDEYAENLRQQGFSPGSRDQTPYDPASSKESKPAAKNTAPARSATNPAKRKYLIPSSFVAPVKDAALLRLVTEGKEQSPDDARFSCNYLNRVILERVVHLYAKKFGVGGQGEFGEVVQRVITHAKSLPTPPSKGISITLIKTADRKASYSYEIMSSSVHGGMIPSGADNRSNWESLQPALEYLLGQMK
jgi:hypothetical protein